MILQQRMQIPALSAVIVKCWMMAEEALRNEIRDKHPDWDEEGVTDLFRDELRSTCEKASQRREVEDAFLSDLKRYLPGISPQELRSKIARGLIATVTFHEKSKEAKTGGDLGIVVIRPDVRGLSSSEVQITDDHPRGLLCQAKILRRDSKWGGFSDKQKETLPEKLGYLGILLYRFADNESDRRFLEAFNWQLAKSGTTLTQIEEWLKSGQFPELLNSAQVLRDLARDQIGTSDKALIERDIAPLSRRSLTITIRWKDDVPPPGKTVHLEQQRVAKNEQKIMQGR